MESLIFILFLFAIVWLIFLMPARRRQKSHQAMQDSVEPGDEIITAGGLHGIVVETGDEDLELEIAPGVVVTLDRRAIAAVARDEPGLEDEVEDEDAAEHEDEPEALKDEPETAEEGSGRV